MTNDETCDVIIDCDICLNEIPDTVGYSVEADEYVSHYCGLDCYQQWQEKQNSE